MLVFSLFLSVKFNIMLPVFLVSLGTADILKILTISLSGFALTAAVFYGLSRKLGFKEMKLHELFVYYFFYSTIWLAIIVVRPHSSDCFPQKGCSRLENLGNLRPSTLELATFYSDGRKRKNIPSMNNYSSCGTPRSLES